MISIALVGLVGLGGFGVLGDGFGHAIAGNASATATAAPMATSQQAAILPAGAVDALASTGKLADTAKVVSTAGEVAAVATGGIGNSVEALVKRVRSLRLEDIGGNARGEIRFGIKLEGPQIGSKFRGTEPQRISIELNDIAEGTKLGNADTRGLRRWSSQLTRVNDGFVVDESTFSARVDELLRNAANEIVSYFDSDRGGRAAVVNVTGGKQGSASVVESFTDELGRLSTYKPIAFADWIAELNESMPALSLDERWKAQVRKTFPTIDGVLEELGKVSASLEDGELAALTKGELFAGENVSFENADVTFVPQDPSTLTVVFSGRDVPSYAVTERKVSDTRGEGNVGDIVRTTSRDALAGARDFPGNNPAFTAIKERIQSLRLDGREGASRVTLRFIADDNAGFRITGGEFTTGTGERQPFQRSVLPRL